MPPTANTQDKQFIGTILKVTLPMNIFRIVVFFLESEINEKFHSLFSERFFCFVFGNEEYLLIDRRLKYCSPLHQEVSSQFFFSCQRVVGSI